MKQIVTAIIILIMLLIPSGVYAKDIHEAAIQGDVNKVKEIIQKEPDEVHAKDTQGRTALHRAAQKGNIEMVEFLIASGADMNAKDDNGRTPLIYALDFNNFDIANLLIEKGANVKIADNRGLVALHWAAGLGKEDLAKVLLSKGTDINVRNTFRGWTPLYTAASQGKKEMVEFLLTKGADINITDNIKRNVLTVALESEEPEIAEVLIKKGINTKNKDTMGVTPLHWACYRGYEGIVKNLISQGADVNLVITDGPYKGYTPLKLAKEGGHEDIEKLLKENGAKK